MHDPHTRAFTIRLPWFRRFGPPAHRMRMWAIFAEVWHRDPCTDGSDDSCGYSAPRLSEADRALATQMAEWEAEHPFYLGQPGAIQNPKYTFHEVSPGDALALTLAAVQAIAWRLDRRRLSAALLRRVLSEAVNPDDNFRALFARGCEENLTVPRAAEVFGTLIRFYRRLARPWWRHPRWHLRHWRVQLPWVRLLRSWLFDRCVWCKKRFGWSESPISHQWDPAPPGWFQSRSGLHHEACDELLTALRGKP